MSEVIPFDEFYTQATNISYAILNMLDAEVHALIGGMHDVAGESWGLACEIAENGPQTDMERRIMAEAVARRLEGK